MAAVSPVTYAEFNCIVTKDPHDGDPSAIFEDETPVHVGGVWATPANLIPAVCGDTNPEAYLLFTKGRNGVPIARVLLQVTMCPHSRRHPSSFAGASISHLEDVRLLGPTLVILPAQVFYVKKAMVPAVAQMEPAYAAGRGGSERLLGPYDVLDTHAEEVEVRTLVHLPYRFVPLALDQHLTPRAAWKVL